MYYPRKPFSRHPAQKLCGAENHSQNKNGHTKNVMTLPPMAPGGGQLARLHYAGWSTLRREGPAGAGEPASAPTGAGE